MCLFWGKGVARTTWKLWLIQDQNRNEVAISTRGDPAAQPHLHCMVLVLLSCTTVCQYLWKPFYITSLTYCRSSITSILSLLLKTDSDKDFTVFHTNLLQGFTVVPFWKFSLVMDWNPLCCEFSLEPLPLSLLETENCMLPLHSCSACIWIILMSPLV